MSEEEKEYYLRKIQECVDYDDEEWGHIYADQMLCEVLVKLGYFELVDAWKKVKRFYI